MGLDPFCVVFQLGRIEGVFCPVVALDHPRLRRSDLNFFWVALCLMQTRFWLVFYLHPQKKRTTHPARLAVGSKSVVLKAMFCFVLLFVLS